MVVRPQPLTMTHNEKYIHMWKQCQKVIRQVRYYKGETYVQNYVMWILMQCTIMWW